MNPEIKERWIEALRSGNYNQAHGKLATDGGYCCLGVLCEIAQEDNVVVQVKFTDSVYYKSVANEVDRNKFGLPGAVQTWAEIGLENPSFVIDILDFPGHLDISDFEVITGTKVRVTLASLNDCRASFDEIASLIEKYL